MLGSRAGTVLTALAFYQCGPGLIPGFDTIMSVESLVLWSAWRGFSPLLKKQLLICFVLISVDL